MKANQPQPDFAELASRIRPGGHIVIHSDFCESPLLSNMLTEQAQRFKGAHVHTLMPVSVPPYAKAPAAQLMQIESFFPGGGLRKAVNEGLAKARRCTLTEIPGFFTRGEIKADLLLLQLSPANEKGQHSLGLSVDYMREVLAQDPIVVAHINPNMPFTCGDTLVEADQIDYLLEQESPLETVAAVAADPVDATIAKHVASLINDGDVLQTGIGALPDAVIANLGHLKHLGLHTGIITQAWQPLIESGVVDNSTKQQFTGVSVTTMAGGELDFYRFLHNNPDIEFHPCSLTHRFETLAAIDNLCAINSVLQIDLSVRANAEVVNGRRISQPGGLPDFARGASAASGGKSIIALRSSFKNGEHSNIVAALGDGVPTSLAPETINYVVTEYGIAALDGLNAEQRASALIAIAHPDHRERLQREWQNS